VIDPDDPDVLYVGTKNAGIYKSIDGGTSWQPKHLGLGRAWILSLVIDPEDTRILYAGVSSGGVFRTSDGGESWSAANTGIYDFGWEFVAALAIDPQDSWHLIYTATSGIFETHDGGEIWSLVNANFPALCFLNIQFHPVDSQTLFAIAWMESNSDNACQGGVYKSDDGGQAWERVGLEGLELKVNISQLLVVDHQSGDLLYTATDEGLYGSRDGGESWQLLSQQRCSGLGIAADDGNIAYCATQETHLLLATANGGDTWTLYNLGQHDIEFNIDVIPIAVSPHDTDTLFIGGQGVYVSRNAGGSWTERNSGLGATLLEIRNTPANWHKPSSSAGLFLLEGNGHRLYQSTDDGRTWALLNDSGQGLAFDAAGEILYRVSNDVLLRSQDGGYQWVRLSLPIDARADAIAVHPVVSQNAYVIYSRGLPPYIYFSKDGGSSWEGAIGMGSISDGMLYFDHDQGQVVYAIGDLDAFRSEDGGESWRRCTNTNEWHSQSDSRMIVDPRNSDRLILATRGGGVLISKDACQSWHPHNNGLSNLFVNTLAAGEDPDTIYAGTDSGAYVSFDGGERWGEISDGLLGAMVVYSIVVDPDDPMNVFAATPYGIFKLEGQ
jgi:photosystem II stability/assembly factor-like uncharacterized protein